MKKRVFYQPFLFLFLSLGALTSYGQCDDPEWGDQDTVLVNNLIFLAWNDKTSHTDDALRMTEVAKEIATTIDYLLGIANAVHVQGMLYWYRGDYPAASELFWEALGIRERINDQLGLGRSYNNIGNIHFYQRQYDTAKYYDNQALDLRQALKDTSGLIYTYSNLGDVVLAQGHQLLSMEYYNEGSRLAQAIDLMAGQANIASRLGEYYIQNDQPQQAKNYLESSYHLAEQCGNDHLLAESLIKLTRLAMLEEQFDLKHYQALSRRALQLGEGLRAIDVQVDAALLLTQLAAAEGKYDSVYYSHDQYQQLTDQLLIDQTSKNMAAIQSKFELKKKAQQAKNAEQASNQRLSNVTNIFLGLLSLFILIFSVVQRRTAKKQKLLNATLHQQHQKITRQNKMLTRKNEVLDQFARSASHDLKEPLRNVGAYANLIQRRYQDKLDDQGIEYLGFVGRGVKQMNQVLDDLLIYSQTSQDPIEKQAQIDLNLLLQEVNEVIVKEHDQTLVLSSQALPTLMGYPRLLSSLFEQLLENALTFTNRPVASVHVGYQKKADFHLFWVEDDGIGIAPRFHEQIFEPFQRLERQIHQGTGIGLALCRRILGHHGGTIWVESEEGKGSCFYFTLPIQSQDEVPGEASNRRKEKPMMTLPFLSYLLG